MTDDMSTLELRKVSYAYLRIIASFFILDEIIGRGVIYWSVPVSVLKNN